MWLVTGVLLNSFYSWIYAYRSEAQFHIDDRRVFSPYQFVELLPELSQQESISTSVAHFSSNGSPLNSSSIPLLRVWKTLAFPRLVSETSRWPHHIFGPASLAYLSKNPGNSCRRQRRKCNTEIRPFPLCLYLFHHHNTKKDGCVSWFGPITTRICTAQKFRFRHIFPYPANSPQTSTLTLSNNLFVFKQKIMITFEDQDHKLQSKWDFWLFRAQKSSTKMALQ